MSMLTPPGMGGKYRVTGNQYPRMRRPRKGRIIAAAVAAVAVLSLLGWGSLQLIDVFGGGGGNSKASAAQKPTCKRSSHPSASASAATSASTSASGKPVALPEPGAVTVNVYNATSKSGLAKKTADALAARGFKIGEFGNAPPKYDQKVKGSALLLGGTKADPSARVLSAQIAGSTMKIDPKRSGKTVDLMIGKGFTKLSSAKDVKKALAVLAKPSPTPTSRSSSKSC